VDKPSVTQNDQPVGKYEELRHLTDTYSQVQKLRIANSNRSFASVEGEDETIPEGFVVEIVEDLEALEKKIFRQMKRTVKHHPAWEWLDGVKGMGPTLSTKILGLISDIEKFETISKLWSFSGYGLYDGKRQTPVKGEKLSYNRRLKTAVYLAGDSFIKSRSPYRDLYDEAKVYYRRVKQLEPMDEVLSLDEVPDRETPDGKKEWDKLIKEANKATGAKNDEAVWSDGHVDNAARRKMVKVFLSHLWLVWREAEGLPVSGPYITEHDPKHTHVIGPWKYSG
jgi:hypothetical protein